MPTVSSDSWFPTPRASGIGRRLRDVVSRASLPVFLATGAIFPFLAGGYWTFTVTVGLILAVSCLGLQVLTGWTGQISLMQAGLTGMALDLNRRLFIPDGWGPTTEMRHHYLFSAAVTVAGTTAVSLAVGWFGARRPLLYPIVATFAVQFLLIDRLFLEPSRFGGLPGPATPRQFLNLDLETDRGYYCYTFAVLLVVLAGVHRLRHSRHGRAMIAVGNDPVSAAAQGISPTRTRVAAFAVAGALAGVAGVLFASLFRQEPGISSFTSTQSMVYLAVVVIAGLGSGIGLVLGAVALAVLPQLHPVLEHRIPPALLAGVVLLVVLGARALRGSGAKARPRSPRVRAGQVPALAVPIPPVGKWVWGPRLVSWEGLALLSVTSLVFDTAAVVRHERGWLPAGVTEYGLSGPVGVSAITTGPDGNLWFAEAKRIGRITPTGRVTEFDDPPEVNQYYFRIAADRGSLLATDSAGATWRIGTTGVFTAVKAARAGLSTTGPDGTVWSSSEYGKQIVRTTPGGRVTSYSGLSDYFFLESMTAGPDGSLWLTGNGDSRIWRLTPSGQVTSYVGLPSTARPQKLTVGADGNLWFVYAAHRLGRITPSGVLTGYLIPGPDLGSLAAGPDGNLWFTAQTFGYYPSQGRIGRIVMAQLPGRTFEYVAPTNWSAVVIAPEQPKSGR